MHSESSSNRARKLIVVTHYSTKLNISKEIPAINRATTAAKELRTPVS
jgi:hypothetical protein